MNTLELVKKAYKAWESKDIDALREILHKDYKAKLPDGMEIIGIEGAKECLAHCPFDSHSENETYITEGDRVVRIWDMVTKSPKEFRLRMAELTVVKDGKVLFNEAFFDQSGFPEEVKEAFKEQQKEHATTGKGKS